MKNNRWAAKDCGDRHYYTGRACVRGHITLRSVASGRCMECDRINSRERRLANPERAKEWMRKYDSTTRKNKPKEYHEKVKARKREYGRERREYFRRLKRENYAKNKEELLKKSKEWRQKNKDIIRALNADYRGRKRGAEGRITMSVVRAMEGYQKMKCNHCVCDISDGYHIDHKTPLVRGGSNLAENLQLLCANCNLKKGSLTQEEFENRERSNAA